MGRRILCVDDEALVRESLTLFCEHAGVEIHCVDSGQACVREFEAGRSSYDLVLVNYDMPGMDGGEVVRRLRQIDRQKRIAVTSGHPESEVFRDVAREEVIAFLRKPFSRAKLRRFFRESMPAVRPEVVVLLEAEESAPPWLAPLKRRFPIQVCVAAQAALVAAKKGYAAVIVWELGSTGVSGDLLHSLKEEGVPIVFIGSAPASGLRLQKQGKVLPQSVSPEELCEAVRLAAQVVPPKNRRSTKQS